MIPCPICRSPARPGRCPFCTAVIAAGVLALGTPALAQTVEPMYGVADRPIEEPIREGVELERAAKKGQLTPFELSVLFASGDVASTRLRIAHFTAIGDVTMARQALDSWVRQAPNDPEPLFQLATHCRSHDDHTCAVERANAALALDNPDERQLALRLLACRSSRSTGDWDAAHAHARAYVELAKRSEKRTKIPRDVKEMAKAPVRD